MRQRRERLHTDGGEINLIPMLDMVSLLVQVLLLNVQFNAFAELPARPVAASSDAEPPPAALDLQVTLTPQGYEISWSTGTGRSERSFPCVGGCDAEGTRLDVEALRALAVDLKAQHPEEDAAVVVPEEGLTFDAVVRTMDALRQDKLKRPLFPDIGLGDLE